LRGHYNGDGRWVFEGSSPARSSSVRWALIHLEDDHCIYRAYELDTGQWASPPLTRRGAINQCREWQWGAIRIQTALGAAILWADRRVSYIISAQRAHAG